MPELLEEYPAADLCLALSYGELPRRSETFAAGLADLGVGPGSRVALLLPKGEDLVICMLAMWLGAVYVPLFTAFAAQAIAMRLEASGAAVVICTTTSGIWSWRCERSLSARPHSRTRGSSWTGTSRLRATW